MLSDGDIRLFIPNIIASSDIASTGYPQLFMFAVMREQAVNKTNSDTSFALISSGQVTREQVYSAALVLARLQDRGVGHCLTVEDICTVVGYVGEPDVVPAGTWGN